MSTGARWIDTAEQYVVIACGELLPTALGYPLSCKIESASNGNRKPVITIHRYWLQYPLAAGTRNGLKHAPPQNASQVAIEAHSRLQQTARKVKIAVLALEKTPRLQELRILLASARSGFFQWTSRLLRKSAHSRCLRGRTLWGRRRTDTYPQARGSGLEGCTRSVDCAEPTLQQRFEHEGP
jgi:hypothetical protein